MKSILLDVSSFQKSDAFKRMVLTVAFIGYAALSVVVVKIMSLGVG